MTLVVAGAEASRHVRQSDIGDAGVEHLHKRRHRHHNGDEPGIVFRPPRSAQASDSISALSDIDFRLHGHTGSQPMVTVLVRINIDSHRKALHYLHEISRGVFRRQQAEPRTACTTNTSDSALVLTAIRVDAEEDSVAWLHQPQLGFLEDTRVLAGPILKPPCLGHSAN